MAISLRNISIGLKVTLAPAVALAGLVVVAAIGWGGLRSLSSEMATIGRDGVARLTAVQTLATRLTTVHQKVYQSLAWEGIGQRAELIKKLDDGVQADLKAMAGTLEKAAADTTASPAQRAALAEVRKNFDAYAKVAVDTLDMKSAGVANAGVYVVTLDQTFATAQAQLGQVVKAQIDDANAQVAEGEDHVRQSAWVIAGVSLAALALCSGLAWVFVRGITRPLGRAAALASELAEGNLTVRHGTEGSDATGRVLAALDQTARNLAGLVQGIRATADQISVASGEIASGNADLSARTEGTASSLQEAAAAVEQLAATIRNNAEHAREANTLARDAAGVARHGGDAVADVVRTMEAINGQARKIADIIGTIDGIAFQTNILALNAAVEAARAGEQGRGFAVVAGEVRTLAQRSAAAAREIRSLIGASVEQIETGTAKAQAAGQTMGRIVGAIEQVSHTVDDIARAAAEQATGIAQVNDSVAEMDRNTQQNAAMVEEATAATESLRGQSHNLVQMLERFRIH